MNPVAGSLTITANAARENSIKGLGEGERNIVSLLIAYFNRANVTTVFPFARISRLHRSTSSYAPCNAYLHFESCNSNASCPSNADRISCISIFRHSREIHRSVISRHPPILLDVFHRVSFLHRKFSNSKQFFYLNSKTCDINC